MTVDICRLFAAVAAVMVISAGARADFMTGNTLYAHCTSANASDQSFCFGYTAAIADAAQGPPQPLPGGGEKSVAGYTQCGPETVTNQQVTDIVVRYLAAHPEIRHTAAWALVGSALEQAFPCPR